MLAMSPSCQSNNILLIWWHEFFYECTQYLQYFLKYESFSITFGLIQMTDGQRERNGCIRAHHSTCTSGLKNLIIWKLIERFLAKYHYTAVYFRSFFNNKPAFHNHTIIWICPSVCLFTIYSAVCGPIATKVGRNVRDGLT